VEVKKEVVHEDNNWGITLVSTSEAATTTPASHKEGLEYAYETTPTVDVQASEKATADGEDLAELMKRLKSM
jgi:hypothetical protein